ncbi:hypothetical protein GYMLUDRAFT_547132 [Collybiopsis luxurians FD-317 M1]|nr:hypothetical protein GYMLUDRAFT_547132 [Collybiopsis luxurians FD-317 M1]
MFTRFHPPTSILASPASDVPKVLASDDPLPPPTLQCIPLCICGISNSLGPTPYEY